MAAWEGRSIRMIPADATLPTHSAMELQASRPGRAVLELFQAPNELREEGLRLAAIELDLLKGEVIRLSCAISASGRLAAELRRGSGERMDIPLLPENDVPGDTSPQDMRRLRELKLRLATVETALSEAQQNRLHALIRKGAFRSLQAPAASITPAGHTGDRQR